MSYLFISTYTWYVFDISSIFFTCLFCRTFIVEIKKSVQDHAVVDLSINRTGTPCASTLFSRFATLRNSRYYSVVSSNKCIAKQNIYWTHAVIHNRYVEIGWNQVSNQADDRLSLPRLVAVTFAQHTTVF